MGDLRLLNKFIIFFAIALQFIANNAFAQERPCERLLGFAGEPFGKKMDDRELVKGDFYWHFPSDHLPVVGTAKLAASNEQFNIVSWNVLNQNYLHHITDEKNSQGLRKSEITESKDRSQKVFEILAQIANDVRPSLIGLQEVDEALIQKIRLWAQNRSFDVLVAENPAKGKKGETIDYGVVLVDSEQWELREGLDQVTFFEGSRGPVKYIQQIGLRSRRSGAELVFVNTHKDFNDKFVLKRFLQQSRDCPIVVVGDLNLDRPDVDAFLRSVPLVSLMAKEEGAFTHIDTRRALADYDHVLYAGNVEVSNNVDLTREARKRFKITGNH